ncbi:MAG TPA: hypothetical protein VNI02_03475 [Blastocatellia bacterium]|nr:hypothetical protein [Blastocatellia bacterium]
MAQTCMITIDKVENCPPGQPQAAFDPQNLTTTAGTIITWCNNTSSPHWPAPKDQNGNVSKTAWMDAEIPGKLFDQPSPTSQQGLSFSKATTVNYVCALHPEEVGTITVQ